MGQFSLKRLFVSLTLLAITIWLWTIIFYNAESSRYPIALKCTLVFVSMTALGAMICTPFKQTTAGALIGAMLATVILMFENMPVVN